MQDTTKELTAADVMQAAVRTVPSAMSLPELEAEFIAASITGFPVVDDGKLVGVVSRSDVVRQICSEREITEKISDFYFDASGFHEQRTESFKEIADRIGVIHEGQLRFLGSVSELQQQMDRHEASLEDLFLQIVPRRFLLP